MAATTPLANRCSSRRLPRSLTDIPARLPQSVHPTSTSDTEEFRGCNRWQQPRLGPIAGNLANFREACFTYLHGCRNLCISHQLRFPRNSENATDGSNRASGQSLFISPTYPSRRLPRSFTYLHGCRNLCIPHQFRFPTNSENATAGSNRASGPSLAISPTSEKLDSHTCTVAAICASHTNIWFQVFPRMQQMAATAPPANRCTSRRLSTVAAICASKRVAIRIGLSSPCCCIPMIGLGLPDLVKEV